MTQKNVLSKDLRTGNAFIKRIWTDRAIYSNIDGTEKNLILWHLPAEKKRGFLKMFHSYRRVGDVLLLTERDFSHSYRLTEDLLEKPLRWLRQVTRFFYHRVRRLLSVHVR